MDTDKVDTIGLVAVLVIGFAFIGLIWFADNGITDCEEATMDALSKIQADLDTIKATVAPAMPEDSLVQLVPDRTYRVKYIGPLPWRVREGTTTPEDTLSP